MRASVPDLDLPGVLEELAGELEAGFQAEEDHLLALPRALGLIWLGGTVHPEHVPVRDLADRDGDVPLVVERFERHGTASLTRPSSRYNGRTGFMGAELLSRETSALVVVDVQEKLLPAIHGGPALLSRLDLLLAAAGLLQVPVLVSEQYP